MTNGGESTEARAHQPDTVADGDRSQALPTERPTVCLFQGDKARYTSRVFESAEQGPRWARLHNLSGTLAAYPVGDRCFDIAVREHHFQPSKPHHGTPDHVAQFGPGLDHIHLTNGERQQ